MESCNGTLRVPIVAGSVIEPLIGIKTLPVPRSPVFLNHEPHLCSQGGLVPLAPGPARLAPGGLYAVEGGAPVQIKAAVFEQNHDNGCGFMTRMTGLNGRVLPEMLAPPTGAVDAPAAIGSGGESAMIGHDGGNGQGEFVNTGGAIHTGPPVDDFDGCLLYTSPSPRDS